MEISKINRRDDATVINKKFGKLLVLRYVFSKNQQRHFECLCDCGNKKTLPKGLLKFGSVKSCGCSKAYKDLEEVFRENTKELNGCIVWTGTVTQEGYGRFKFRNKVYSAHRAHWEARIGKIPEGMILCHHCDNRACIKIEHLYPAGPAQNSKDMVRKGRQAKGGRNGSAKLRELDVIKIFNTPHEISISTLAKQYGVHHSTIRRILNKKTWRHLDETADGPQPEINELSPFNSKPHTSRKVNSRLKVKVLKRDNSMCLLCGASPAKDPQIQLHIDHIIPCSQGGKTSIENLQTLCSSCNLGKGSEIL